jgi:hypothetical protein
MQAHMTYKALNAALNKGPAAAASLICIQFAFSLFLGSSAAEDLLTSGALLIGGDILLRVVR